MAAPALRILMRSAKLEFRLVMIELRGFPAAFTVAVIALLAELTLVDVILFMAVDTLRLCIAILHIGFMACSADDLPVRAMQRKISKPMIEGLRIHLDYVCLSANVIGVTNLAFRGTNVLDQAVVPRAHPDILVHFLVAGPALDRLLLLAECGMTFVAVMFVFCVSFNYLTRHHQGLKYTCICRHAWNQHQNQNDYCSPCTHK